MTEYPPENIKHILPREVTVQDFTVEGVILDLGGGGEGVIGRLKGAQVIAVGRDTESLDTAPAGPAKLVADIRSLPFVDNCFPLVTAFLTFMYLLSSDLNAVFAEVYRVLQSGGQLHIWDAVLPPRKREEIEKIAFHLRVKLPGEEVLTGYEVPWPSDGRDLSLYTTLGRCCGFTIGQYRMETGVFSLVLQK